MKTSNLIKYQSKNPIQIILIRRFYKKMVDMLKDKKIDSVADVGCGEGFGLKNMAIKKIGKKYLGLDTSKNALRLANKMKPEFIYVLGDIYKTPFENNKFDLVICSEGLEHLEKPEAAIKEIKRISRKYVLISVPYEPWFRILNFLRGKYLRMWGNHPEHINRWGEKGIKKLVSKNIKIKRYVISLPWQILLCEVLK